MNENRHSECVCTNCDCKYYVGRKYHRQLMIIFWKISKYFLKRPSLPNIPDNRDLETAIMELERIYENE